ncbi:MAG TPA: SDR family NAD(P)-dependent oxidoreductase [Pseudonocardiaceae bacterium]|nr:SDR family NAD(P)-dependent oxidoreductase [Pseudonocardiaceae bacterium]
MSDHAAQDMRGRTVVVTGASAGIGAAAARQFADLGATVAVVGRSAQKTAAAAAALGAQAHLVDHSRLDDVRRLADELLARYPRIDILANNAGGVFTRRTTTADGHEMTFQVNHLAPFLLTNLLLDRLTAAPDGARVINTASTAYRTARLDLNDLDRARGRYSGSRTYGATKLANILFTRELARRTQGTGLTTSAFHPGTVASDIGREGGLPGLLFGSRLSKMLLSTPAQGAEPLVRLATTVDTHTANGQYFHRFTPEDPKNKQATDPHLAQQLWEYSAQLTGVRTPS